MYVQPPEDVGSSTTSETLQDKLLASQPVLNAFLDEFSNIDSIYESYKPTIQSAVQLLKTDSENMSLPKNQWSERSLLPFRMH